MIVSLTSGFECSGKVEVTQEPVFEQGSGYDVRQREYKASGWEGSVYRDSEITGTSNLNTKYHSVVDEKYVRLNLTYDQFSVGGWQEYLNNLATEIYFPVSLLNKAVKLTKILNKQLEGVVAPIVLEGL